jgi:hypothetical protein
LIERRLEKILYTERQFKGLDNNGDGVVEGGNSA